jgi:pimeloyl-ACP methyl ester carboxylesterase
MVRKLLLAASALLLLFVAGIILIIRPDIAPSELEIRYGGPTSQFVEIDGMRVHFRDEGAGPAVLLLHGTFASLHAFDAWTAQLTDSLRVVRLDLPGFGLTGPHPEHDYSLASTLWLIDSLRMHLGIERWSIGGNSLGGRLAYQYALRFPDKVEKLLLIDAAGFPETQPQPVSSAPPSSRTRSLVFRIADTPVLKYLLSVCTPRFWYKATLKQVYAEPERITPELIDRYYMLLRREGNRTAFLKRGEAGQKRAFVQPLPEPVSPDSISIPVLIQWGEKDRWIPVSNGRRYQQALKTSRLIIYPDAGHVPMEETPEQTGRDARSFLLGKL